MAVNVAQLHLVMNHWPVLLPIASVPVIVVGLTANLRQTRNTGLALLIIGSLLSVGAYLTGAPAREIVQNYPQVTSSTIEVHQNVALLSLAASLVVGALSAWFLWIDRRREAVSNTWFWMLLGLIVIVCLLMANTAHLGGEIRHEELMRGKFLESGSVSSARGS